VARLAILDDYQHAAERLVEWSHLGPDLDVTVFHERLEGEALVNALVDFDMILAMRERSAFPRSTLSRLPKLKLIATTGMANAAIDLEAAADLGILVSGTRSGLHSTTEIAWALILGVVKGLPRADSSVRNGTWQRELPGDLAGKTLGLVGLGRLGSSMVPIAKAFSMQVVAWSQNLTAEQCDDVGAELVSKADLLRESDVISIHLRLSERTTGLIGANEFALMGPQTVLINTSRGPIVDEAALIEALRDRRIGGAGLDVYDTEPVAVDHPLLTFDNVVLTPHLGYASESNLLEYFGAAFDNIAAYLNGTPQRLIGPNSAPH
jgi:phosphoglycerate dehydrogenase-like enzyme